MTAYRTAAQRDVFLEPLPLRKFETLAYGGLRVPFGIERYVVNCRKCRARSADVSKVCLGGRRGFLWLRRCEERREHFHVACSVCGAEELMDVAEPR